MIDFRYHIVSIVSIFLALAVGILLGAGPLQEDLGTTLTNQVSTLRQEKTDLRTQLDVAQQRLEADDEFATDVTPQLVGSRLGGYPIVLVTLPGADADATTELATVLTASGATITGTVAVTGGWTDPAKAGARERLANSLAPVVGTGDGSADATSGDATSGGATDPATSGGATPSDASPDDDAADLDVRLGRLLAGALVVPRLTDAGRTTTASTQTLAGLAKADLVTFDGAGPVLAALAIVIAPPPDPKLTDERRAADLSGWLGLARALDARGRGAAVVGDPASATSGGLVAAVRSDAAARAISTVDSLARPMGRIATVYALREQVAGGAGQYGTGAGATAVLPTLPAAGP